MNYRIALTLFTCMAPLLTVTIASQEETPSRVEISVKPCADAPVGSVSRPITGWNRIGERWQNLRDWGKDSLAASDALSDGEFILVLDWDLATKTPSELVWFPAGNDSPKIHTQKLVWQQMVPGLFVTSVALSTPGTAGLKLKLQVQRRKVFSAKWSGKACFESRFELGGKPHIAWFTDSDFDGRLHGSRDRWIVGPEDYVRKLQLLSPRVQMRPLEAKWCIGSHTLHFVSMKDGRAVLTVALPSDRAALLAQHLARVQSEFITNLPARKLLLKGHGEDSSRPAVKSPMPWRCVTSMEEARAFARKESKPLLVDFTAFDCGWCRLLTHITHHDAEVDGLLRKFACVKFITNLDPLKEYRKYGITGFPFTVVFSTDGKVLGKSRGFSPPSKYAAELADWLIG